MPIPSVKLGAIERNLHVVLDAVMQERSATRDGQRLGLSQRAMSQALTPAPLHVAGTSLAARDCHPGNQWPSCQIKAGSQDDMAAG
jgi:hypothetical protein